MGPRLRAGRVEHGEAFLFKKAFLPKPERILEGYPTETAISHCSTYTCHHASPGISSQKRCFAPSKDAFFWRSHPEGSDTTGFDEPAAAKV